MEPTPVPRTPVSQRIGGAAPAESKEDEAAATGGAIVLTQQDCVDTWSTDKIETFAPAAEQMIVVRNVGKPYWKVFRTMSILLLTSRGAAWDRPRGQFTFQIFFELRDPLLSSLQFGLTNFNQLRALLVLHEQLLQR